MKLLARVVSHWDLDGARDPRLLHGGFSRVITLALTTAAGDVVVRVAPDDVDAASIEWEHALRIFLRARVPEVVAPLGAPDGSTWIEHNRRVVSVLPFLDGVTPTNAAVRGEAAALLARIHATALTWERRAEPRPGFPSLRDLDWEDNHVYRWSDVARFVDAETRVLLRRELDELREWVASVPRDVVFAPVHGDFFRRNLIVDRQRIVGVIDWDNARPDWLVWELGRSTWEFCHEGAVLDVDAARQFVAAYVETGGPGSELDLLMPSMRSLRLLEPLSLFTDAARGGVLDADYVRDNLEALAALRRATPAVSG